MSSLTRRSDLDRRTALKLLAAAMATATVRCSPPDEEIVPYAEMPEGLVAGEPMRFATTLALSGYGRGFVGVSVDGRPVKIEGNPRHPYSLGATDVFAEAAVLSLYDHDRSTVVRRKNQITTWAAFAAEWRHVATSLSGAGIALVTGRILSPTTLAGIDVLQQRFPGLRWYRYEPVNDDAARAGARSAFGRVVQAMARWEDADCVLSLGADPLGHGPEELRFARAYALRRNGGTRQRIHVVESAWTLTGATADFRLALKPATIREIARAIANQLGADLGEARLDQPAREFAQRAYRDLLQAKGRALVFTGETQPPEMHALCHWINARLSAPVAYLPSPDPVENDHASELAALADDLRTRRIAALIIADANPVYDAPDRLQITDTIASVPFSAHLGLYQDETAACCRWHLPLSHALESWGDALAPDGTASLIQPLIRQLYDTRTVDELVSFLGDGQATSSHDLTRRSWSEHADGDFESWWRTALHDGVVSGSGSAPLKVEPAHVPDLPFAESASTLEVVLSPDSSVWDGRFANNAWLQECPGPFTKQVWGNAFQLAPSDAARLEVNSGDTIELELDGNTVSAPAVVTGAHAEGVIAITLGHGRSRAGRIGSAIGTRICGLGPHPLARVLRRAIARKSAKLLPFHSPQPFTRLTGRTKDIFRVATPAELTNGSAPRELEPPSMLDVPPRGEYAWAMVVDTDACIGCNACVVACQAENNVPIVGPQEIALGRDMHWLRVDGWAWTEGSKTRHGFQPVPCMHCELAPCEPVCPVEASVHDHEGLNVQVYNRCIGTRFCEANCPYKVRRFNWFAYAGAQAYGGEAAALKAQHNPDVSARGRGVMEKCNYCLQRISRARRNAERGDRPIAEGEVVTACQAACPTRAIHFGDLNREDSDVSRLRRRPQHYTLLEELNTRPRTTYLKRIYNSDDPGE